MSDRINTHELLKDITKREMESLDSYQKIASEQGPNTCNSVVANPGSGKTRTLITRTLNLHTNHGVPLDHITLITFTRKSAFEIEERFKKLILEVVSEEDLKHIALPRISTVNAYGYRILKHYTENKNPSTLSAWQSYDLMERTIKETCEELKYSTPDNKEIINKICNEYKRIISRNELNNFFSIEFDKSGKVSHLEEPKSVRYKEEIIESDWFKLNRLNSAGVLERDKSQWEKLSHDHIFGQELVKNYAHDIPKILASELQEIYLNYTIKKVEQNKIDFSDQSLYPFLLLAQHPEILKKVRKKHQICLVDEAQDIDHTQWALLWLIYCHDKVPTLTLIGDPKQTLYGFRNATHEFITDLGKLVNNKHGESETQHILTNYRSPKSLVEITNEFSKTFESFDIEVQPSEAINQINEPCLNLKIYPEVEDEISYVLDNVEKLRDEQNVIYKDMVVLARRNFQIELMEPELIVRMIPYVMFKNSDEESNSSAFKLIYNYLHLLKNDDNFDVLMDCMEYVYGVGGYWVQMTRDIYNTRMDNLDFNQILNKWEYRSSKKDIKMFRMIATIQNIRYKAEGINDPEQIIDIIFETLQEGFQFKLDDSRKMKDGGRLSVSLYDLDQVKRTFGLVVNKLKESLDYKILSDSEKYERFVEVLSVTQGNKSNDDDIDETNKLLISTIHGYKGREADYVFHYHTFPIGTFRADFAELCAFYVGCTRAKKKMFLTANLKSYTQKFQKKETSRNKFFDRFINATMLVKENSNA